MCEQRAIRRDMKFILGTKLGMSQVFDEKGKTIPVTIVEAGPCFVTQIKTKEKDRYNAVQVGFGYAKHIKKPRAGHLKKVQSSTPYLIRGKVQSFGKWVREFKVEKPEFNLGDEIRADIFKEGEIVKVSGISKGKGFTGVVKRYGFKGGPKSHGQKHQLRAPGSIGSSFPEHVRKGTRMAGRAGGEKVTVRNLEIVKVDAENNILAIKGAVPGRRGMLLEINSLE